MTSRKLSWLVEHWHFSILVMKTIFLTWHSMAVTRMAMTLVAVMRSLMTARMTSVLMGVVTVVVTMVKDSDERTELMILKGRDFYRNFNHILYSNK